MLHLHESETTDQLILQSIKLLSQHLTTYKIIKPTILTFSSEYFAKVKKYDNFRKNKKIKLT